MKKKALAILLATTLVMGSITTFVGCSDKDKDPEKPTVQEYTGIKTFKDTNGKVKTLNPHTYTLSTESGMMGYINDSFFQLVLNDTKDNYKFVPSMLKEMPKISEDKKVYTMTLRDGLKFSTGKAIDADTFIYSYKMLLDPKLKNYRANNCFSGIYIKNAEEYFEGKCKWEDVGIKALDKKTLQFTLDLATPELNALIAFSSLGTDLVEPDLYEKGMNADRTETTYGTSMDLIASYGPYKMVDWKFDQYFKVEKYKDGGSPMASIYTPDIVECRVVEEAATVLQLFENNEVDSAGISAASYQKYAEDPRMYMSPTGSILQMTFNLKSETQPILKDINFRKAMYFATNREKLGKDVSKTDAPAPYILSGYFSVMIGGKPVPYRDTDAAKAVMPKNGGFDEKLAKEYFEKAYAANGNKKISLNAMYNQSNDTTKAIVESTKNDMEKLFGADKFELKLQAVPSQVRYENVKKGDFEIAYVGWGGGDPFDAASKMEVYTSGWGDKIDHFYNKEFDDLQERCAKGDLMLKEKEKVEAIARMEKLLLDEVPFVPVTESRSMVVYSDKLKIQAKKWIPLVGYGVFEAKFTRE